MENGQIGHICFTFLNTFVTGIHYKKNYSFMFQYRNMYRNTYLRFS